ncbi:MAG: type VI secretion system baseplate subunit TssE [Planctomycetia bacterium]|nr:type VI secretion system baseplate subunit TssE [Planctomycetia bacterium]
MARCRRRGRRGRGTAHVRDRRRGAGRHAGDRHPHLRRRGRVVTPVDERDEVLPSLLDRLLDDRPDETQEPRWREATAVRVIKTSLCRDLQNLLNTRRSLDDLPEHFECLRTSLLNYGLPDLQSREIREDHDLEVLSRRIADLIEAFEPRLRQVRVTAKLDGGERRPVDRRLRFLIEAVLVVEPLRESIAMVSDLDVTGGEFTVGVGT